MNNILGSYPFDTLINQEYEGKRLVNQATSILKIEQKIWSQVGLTSGMKVLDVGCGSGIVSQVIAQWVHPGEVIGIDLSNSLLSQAQKNQQETGISNLKFQPGNAYYFEFPDNSFDFVYSRLLFQHLKQPNKVLEEIFRVLKPRGIICIVDVDDQCFFLHPEPEYFTCLRHNLAEVRQQMGGDPFVGRKLGSYLAEAGLNNVNVRVEIVTTDKLGLDTFLSLFSFGKLYPSIDNKLATIAQKEVQNLINFPYVCGGFGLFTATGTKLI